MFLKKSDKPILTRYYIFRSKYLGIKIHKLKGDKEYHNHPWWAFSIIFGYYKEHLESLIKSKLRFGFNIISPWKKHKIKVHKPTWTVFVNFWRVNENWTYGDDIKPWRGPDDK